MKRYVLGVAITPSGQYVTILKQRPEWQKGLRNFVGGKIDSIDELPEEAMVREFREETGVETTANEWSFVGKMFRTDDFEMYVFHAINDKFYDCKTMEDEEIDFCSSYEITEDMVHSFMPNLPWLVKYVESSDFSSYGCTFEVSYGGQPLHV